MYCLSIVLRLQNLQVFYRSSQASTEDANHHGTADPRSPSQSHTTHHTPSSTCGILSSWPDECPSSHPNAQHQSLSPQPRRRIATSNQLLSVCQPPLGLATASQHHLHHARRKAEQVRSAAHPHLRRSHRVVVADEHTQEQCRR